MKKLKKIGRKETETTVSKETEPDVEKIEKLEEEFKSETQEESTTETPLQTTSFGDGEKSSQDIPPETGPEVKRKRGRPKGSKNAKTAANLPPVIPEALAISLIKMPYEIYARKQGEHWRLSEFEAQNMLPAHMALANKYLPEMLKEHIDLYAVLLMHGLAIFVRMEIEMKVRAEKAKQNAEPAVSVNEDKETGDISYGKIIEKVQ